MQRNVASLYQKLSQAGDEQRMAFCLACNERHKFSRKIVRREPGIEVGGDLVAVQGLQENLFAYTMGLQFPHIIA